MKKLKTYPFRKTAVYLFDAAGILVVVGAVLYVSNEQNALAAASLAWLPAVVALLAALSLFWWDGKDDGSGGGHVGPL